MRGNGLKEKRTNKPLKVEMRWSLREGRSTPGEARDGGWGGGKWKRDFVEGEWLSLEAIAAAGEAIAQAVTGSCHH